MNPSRPSQTSLSPASVPSPVLSYHHRHRHHDDDPHPNRPTRHAIVRVQSQFSHWLHAATTTTTTT
ncbi:hypothetical protein EX30DRAFT_342366 [Ascodesmis nigricans]|uniref:Uncharacterized protein n=1 Tax=Ascodesmis nigricans TaxID=341454 RepID=A0A4S2MQI0_9PEZI|nr:hypothetical protein EX30DRAFT_342366 [Ascodesmis nigricans]